jgi:hypothetical protein
MNNIPLLIDQMDLKKAKSYLKMMGFTLDDDDLVIILQFLKNHHELLLKEKKKELLLLLKPRISNNSYLVCKDLLNRLFP